VNACSNIYAIFDKKSGTYGNFFVLPNDDLAVRFIKSALIDDSPKNLYRHFASDYELYCVGSVDLNSGEISSNYNFIANFSAYKE
jgi:hypothetical protein